MLRRHSHPGIRARGWPASDQRRSTLTSPPRRCRRCIDVRNWLFEPTLLGEGCQVNAVVRQKALRAASTLQAEERVPNPGHGQGAGRQGGRGPKRRVGVGWQSASHHEDPRGGALDAMGCALRRSQMPKAPRRGIGRSAGELSWSRSGRGVSFQQPGGGGPQERIPMLGQGEGHQVLHSRSREVASSAFSMALSRRKEEALSLRIRR